MDVLLNTRVGTRYYNIWFILIFISHNNKINWYVIKTIFKSCLTVNRQSWVERKHNINAGNSAGLKIQH